MHDNFGKPCFSYEKKQHELLAMGRGDLHLPVGFGEIPVAEALAQMPRYTGVLMQEVRPRYQVYCREMLAHMQRLIQPGAVNKAAAGQG